MGNKASSTAGGAAAGGGGGAAGGNSNLNAMGRGLKGILDAAGNSASANTKAAFDEFKETVITCKSRAYQDRLAQINKSSSAEVLKEIRADINAKITAINTQYRALVQKMSKVPAPIFAKLNQYSMALSDIQAGLSSTLKASSFKAGELIKAKEAELAKFAASMPSVPTTLPGELTLEQRLAALKAAPGGPPGSMGGGRRRRSRKAHKKAKRTSRKAHKKVHKGKKRNAVAA